MIEPEELRPGTLVCLDAQSGIQHRYQRLMPRFEVEGMRRTVQPQSWPYIWLTGWELDEQHRPITQIGWTFLRRDGISVLGPRWRRPTLIGPTAQTHVVTPGGRA